VRDLESKDIPEIVQEVFLLKHTYKVVLGEKISPHFDDILDAMRHAAKMLNVYRKEKHDNRSSY
jgi:hypothetical protein